MRCSVARIAHTHGEIKRLDVVEVDLHLIKCANESFNYRFSREFSISVSFAFEF